MEQLLSEEIDMAAKTRTMFMEAVIARTKLENEVRKIASLQPMEYGYFLVRLSPSNSVSCRG